MNKKKLLTGLVALGLSSCTANADVKPVQTEQKVSDLLTLTSTPDEGTEYDDTLARLSRGLAWNLSVTKETQVVIDEDHALFLYLNTIVDGVEYNVAVADYKHDDSGYSDTLNLIVHFTDANGEQKKLSFVDWGLDGRVDLGFTEEGSLKVTDHFFKKNKTGLEFQEFYQTKYQEELGKLLGFFGRE